MYMKFHTYLPIKGILADNLYEISNTLRNLLTLARYYIRKTEYNRPALKLCDGSYLTVGSSKDQGASGEVEKAGGKTVL